jgi:hypothetical protein
MLKRTAVIFCGNCNKILQKCEAYRVESHAVKLKAEVHLWRFRRQRASQLLQMAHPEK